MSISKSLSSKVNGNGYAQVMLLVVKGRQGRFRIKSNVFVPVEYWNEKKNDLVIPRKIGNDLLKELHNKRKALSQTISNIETLIDLYKEKADKKFVESTLPFMSKIQGVPTTEKIDELIQKSKIGDNAEETDIFSIAEIFLQKGYAEARIRLVRSLLRTMQRYQYYRTAIKHDPFCWDLETTSKEDILGLFDFIDKEHTYTQKYEKQFALMEFNEPNKSKKRTLKPRGNNRQVSMRKAIKAFWNWMIKTERTQNNPFFGIEIGSEKYGTPFYLTLEERNLIANYDLSKRPALEAQRDIFIFQCLVGCRVGDLRSFTADNIVNGMLVYMPHKTKDKSSSFEARVPLNETALALIEKYKGKDKKGRLFPFIADQNYNYAIKDILELCEINRMVSVRNSITNENEMRPLYEVASSHMARRTFIGTLYKKVKDPNLIGRMSGHVEDSRAFARYRDIDDDDLKEVIDLID